MPSINEHERIRRLLSGYVAFISALAIAVVTKSKEISNPELIISLLTLSLPSLIALLLLDYVVRIRQGGIQSASRGLAALLGFLPSLSGLSVLIANYSCISAVLFLLLTFGWVLIIYKVAKKTS